MTPPINQLNSGLARPNLDAATRFLPTTKQRGKGEGEIPRNNISRVFHEPGCRFSLSPQRGEGRGEGETVPLALGFSRFMERCEFYSLTGPGPRTGPVRRTR